MEAATAVRVKAQLGHDVPPMLVPRWVPTAHMSDRPIDCGCVRAIRQPQLRALVGWSPPVSEVAAEVPPPPSGGVGKAVADKAKEEKSLAEMIAERMDSLEETLGVVTKGGNPMNP